MNDLVIHLKKKTDGSAALSCQRADGLGTWHRQDGQQGRFFPRHDLTHYAVETVLGHPRGFYGLVAEGWNLVDFGKPWPKGPLPVEALASELIVGFLDRERAAGVEWSASDFNASAETFCAQRGLPSAGVVTDDELRRIRDKRRELFAEWAALPAGAILEVRITQPRSRRPPPWRALCPRPSPATPRRPAARRPRRPGSSRGRRPWTAQCTATRCLCRAAATEVRARPSSSPCTGPGSAAQTVSCRRWSASGPGSGAGPNRSPLWS